VTEVLLVLKRVGTNGGSELVSVAA
jgi:hypothetical protein